MTAIAFCRIPLTDLVCFRIRLWTLETSDQEKQDKANWRSRTRRRWAINKPLSAHWFLEALDWRSATFDCGRMAPLGFFEEFQSTKRWRLATFNLIVPQFIRPRARRCDFLRSRYSSSCAGRIGRGSSAHGDRSKRRFSCAAWARGQPRDPDQSAGRPSVPAVPEAGAGGRQKGWR